MKIVVLDGYTLNPGDLSWEKLESLGDLTVYDRTAEKDVVERAEGADIILTNKTIVSREAIAALPVLKYIGIIATGFNIVDIEAASEKDIPVCNVRGYGTGSVAQHAFALLLELTNQCGLHAQSVRDGGWHTSKDFCYWEKPMMELEGKTLGIIGLGRIGRKTASIALGFGMKVMAFHTHPEDVMEGVSFTDLETLFSHSDVLSLHCPLTPENEGMINQSTLKKMKNTAFLINTSRGGLINHDDLALALEKGDIAGAGLDVFSVEPPVENHRLFSMDNCFITPHHSWATKEARERLMQGVVENVRAFISGKVQHAVNRHTNHVK